MIKPGLKNLIYFALNKLRFLFPRKGFSSILMYHSVGGNGAFFTVKSENFEWQMDYLKKNNFRTLFLAELAGKMEKGEILNSQNIVLTFDDGYEDNYRNVFPILKKHNFRATIFLTTDFIGKEMGSRNNPPLKMLNWEQILEMDASGLVDFQPHGASHAELNAIADANAEKEILESRKILEEELSKKCDFFAYPRGKYNEKIIELLKSNRFKGAVTVREGVTKKNDALFELKRNSIDSKTTKIQFIGKTSYSVEIFRKIFKSK